jgi:hypothetical protein
MTPREYRILHHRQSLNGGHWDLVENPIPSRSAAASAPHGDGSLCAALQTVTQDGWQPLMDLGQAQAQPGETFILVAR